MTTVERTPLFELLPAVYRIRDAERDGALEALLSIIDGQLDQVESDIAGLYDDWFIETCAEWVVPYIGDLLGVRNLHEIESAGFSRRAYVANTLAYRRRKGTLAVLEQLARDVTGWPAKAVEFFELLSTTQFLNHLRDHNRTTLDLRSPDVELVGTAFETSTHSGEVRRIASARGRYNILNIGLHLWSLQAYSIEEVEARQLAPGDYRFFFEPVDLSALEVQPPLFNSPEAESDITDLAGELNVPGILRHRPLHDELDDRRQAIADDIPLEEVERAAAWFGASPALEIRIASEGDPIPPEEIVICNLMEDSSGAWRRPAASLDYISTDAGEGTVSSAGTTVSGTGTHFQDYFSAGDSVVAGDQTIALSSIGSDTSIETSAPFNPALPPGTRYRRSRPAPIRVGVDPRLGRLALAEGEDHDGVRVGYAYGFSGDVGGGPYDRRESLEQWVEPPATVADRVTWHVGVAKDPDPVAMPPNQIFSTLAAAIAEWNSVGSTGEHPFGLISVMDSSTYAESLTGADRVTVPDGGTLIVAGAEWPAPQDEDGNIVPRRAGRIVPIGKRPHVLGDIELKGEPGSNERGSGRVVIDGLLIEGEVTVLPGDLRAFLIAHCTLVPTRGGLLVRSTDSNGLRNENLTVELVRSISGPVRVHRRVEELSVTESIIDAAGHPFAISGPASTFGSVCRIVCSTVLGRTKVQQITLGSESIFAERVLVERAQMGCMRFSYVPRHPDAAEDSRTPRRYRCQPDLALAEAARELGVAASSDLPDNVAQSIRSRIRPHFTNRDYGLPGYTQLTTSTATEITSGAENESEMGVWWHLMNHQRAANLRAALDEYLRFGLEAGSFRVT